MDIRINKLLSDMGLGSRREVEQYVNEGRVAINGRKAKLSDHVEEEDFVTLDGEELPVEDIMREYVAEQKIRIAEQLAGYSLDDEFESEKNFGSTSKSRRPKTFRAESSFSNKSFGKKSGRPAQNTYEEDGFRPRDGRKPKFKEARKGGKESYRKQTYSDEDNSYTPSFSFNRGGEKSTHSRPHREGYKADFGKDFKSETKHPFKQKNGHTNKRGERGFTSRKSFRDEDDF